jgi:hypothetical protein
MHFANSPGARVFQEVLHEYCADAALLPRISHREG